MRSQSSHSNSRVSCFHFLISSHLFSTHAGFNYMLVNLTLLLQSRKCKLQTALQLGLETKQRGNLSLTPSTPLYKPRELIR